MAPFSEKSLLRNRRIYMVAPRESVYLYCSRRAQRRCFFRRYCRRGGACTRGMFMWSPCRWRCVVAKRTRRNLVGVAARQPLVRALCIRQCEKLCSFAAGNYSLLDGKYFILSHKANVKVANFFSAICSLLLSVFFLRATRQTPSVIVL